MRFPNRRGRRQCGAQKTASACNHRHLRQEAPVRVELTMADLQGAAKYFARCPPTKNTAKTGVFNFRLSVPTSADARLTTVYRLLNGKNFFLEKSV
jgi:hypothetical protein